jgi:uncharacterized protein (TIGR03083 family)
MEPVEVVSIAPIGRGEAPTLAATEYQRVIELLQSLEAEEWARPTACDLWDVRALAGHLLGMAEACASVRQFVHDFRAGRSRTSGTLIDALTATQVRERAELTTDELVDRFVDVAPRAVEGRRRVPLMLRRAVRFKLEGPFDGERLTLGFLFDVIATRDPWMHRLDISRATGRGMAVSRDHDGRLVADVVAEWARRHGRPFSLTLTGAAGGRWCSGVNGERLELDALDFCSTLSGRDGGDGLLATVVPF